MNKKWNPIVNDEFFELADSIENPDALFVSDPPEHQWEGKYRLKEGDVFVEAGAFWGRYGLIASKRVGPTGKVILIEPYPENVQMIKNVIKWYNLTNVIIVEAAVWNEDKILDFYILGNPAGGNVTKYRIDKPKGIIKVQVYKLDTILTNLKIEYVDLLAADVENAEIQLVQGAEKYFTEHRIKNVAIAAYHVKGNSEFIINFLKSKGYKNLEYYHSLPHYGGVVYGNC